MKKRKGGVKKDLEYKSWRYKNRRRSLYVFRLKVCVLTGGQRKSGPTKNTHGSGPTVREVFRIVWVEVGRAAKRTCQASFRGWKKRQQEVSKGMQLMFLFSMGFFLKLLVWKHRGFASSKHTYAAVQFYIYILLFLCKNS